MVLSGSSDPVYVECRGNRRRRERNEEFPVSNPDTETYVPYEESMVLYGKDDASEEDGKNHSEEEEETARKMIARYVKWAPERMKKVIALCNTGKTNKERAQSVQQYLAPDGTSGGGDGNFDFVSGICKRCVLYVG